MAKVKHRVGIIGCGMIFDRHLEAITTNAEAFELAAICDIDPHKRSHRAAEYDVPGFADYREMLKKMKGKMTLVVIATPNSLHYQEAIDALEAGYDVLVEKPIDFTASRVEEIVAVAKKCGRQAYAVLQVRYNPTVGMVREALAKGLIGDIRSVSLIQRWQRPFSYFESWRADRQIGGRTLYEVGIHYLDIVQLLFGVPTVKASATFNNKHKHVDFEDTVFAIMQFPSRASGSLEVTIASEPSNLECSIAALGSEGYLKIGGRALDQVEKVLFANDLLQKKWQTLAQNYGASVEPNSYGTHAGSCPNHPTLYQEIASGRGIKLEEALNSIRFIEAVYAAEVE